MSLDTIFKIIASMSFAGSVVAAIILLAKGVFRSRLGAGWHYLVWALLLIRLTVPAMPQSPLSIFSVFKVSAPEISYTWEGAGRPAPNQGAQTGTAAPDTAAQGNAGPQAGGPGILSLIWAGGALATLLYALGVNGVFLMRLRRKPRCGDGRILAIFNQCRAILNIRKNPALVYDPGRRAPVLHGLVRPKILVDPAVLRSLNDDDIRHIFLHELAHLKRMDILINWVTVIVGALHWFNPVVWYANYRMRQDREVACDAYVLNYLKPDEYKKYGETIIRLLQSLSARRWEPVAVGMAGNSKSTIKRRITMIKMFKKTSFRWTAVAVAVMLIIGAVALTNSPANANTDDNTPLPQAEQTPGESTAPEATPPAAGEDPAAPWQVPAPYDLSVVQADQDSVDAGHSPWQLSPVMVAQVFVSLQLSPEGIVGDYPIGEEDIAIVSQDDAAAVLAIAGDATPVRAVYLKRLVRQDDTGIWTVVGYDPVEE